MNVGEISRAFTMINDKGKRGVRHCKAEKVVLTDIRRPFRKTISA